MALTTLMLREGVKGMHVVCYATYLQKSVLLNNEADFYLTLTMI